MHSALGGCVMHQDTVGPLSLAKLLQFSRNGQFCANSISWVWVSGSPGLLGVPLSLLQVHLYKAVDQKEKMHVATLSLNTPYS